MDNCEHLLEPVRALVTELIARCPGLRVLATSRQRLDVAGERVLRIGPLPAGDQVALFCDRAALLRADFTGDARSRELAGEICRLVDGLPLAVELAARRESVFGLVHLRDRLGAGLNVLDPARGGDRSTAVSATVEWSYRLLDPAAQRLLDRLAVCRGGFTLDALPHFAVPADRGGAPGESGTVPVNGDAEALLAELVDASLVNADPPRYRLLETVRLVGLGHLGPDGEHRARDAHARWMLTLADEMVDRCRVRDPWTYPAMRRELANLQEALAWLTEGGGDRDEGARLAAMLAVIGADSPDPGLTEQLARLAPPRVESDSDILRAFAAGTGEWLRGHLPEADRLLTAALDRMPGDHPLRWGVLLIRISNGMFAGRPDLVRADAERIATDTGAPAWARATGICCSALMDAYGGDPAAGRRWLERYAAHLDTEHLDGFVPFTRGEMLAGDDPARALAWYDRSIAASSRVNLIYTAHVARVGRAAALIRLGRLAEAVEDCRTVLLAVRSANMTAQVWTMIRLIAELLAALGDAEPAAALVTAADADPLAPAVMGRDRDRLAALRTVTAAPPPVAGPAAAADLALHHLTAAGRRMTQSAGA
ncbi:ATP-binding protein [Actinoplanes xinjiangensis]|uniref:ATP-binding protein n=1 Tax=Actinoplanes xinjiangensis TaxID=512350 RepID=UPI003426D5A7